MDFFKKAEASIEGGSDAETAGSGQGGFLGQAAEFAQKSFQNQGASEDASAIDSAAQGAGADASRAAADTTGAGTNAVPGQAGGFNLQSVVSEYATEANMQNTADGVFGQQTGQIADYEKKGFGMLCDEIKNYKQ